MGQMLKKQARILSEIAAFVQPAQLGQNYLYGDKSFSFSEQKQTYLNLPTVN